jgi:hypothetical protein
VLNIQRPDDDSGEENESNEVQDHQKKKFRWCR